MKRTLKSVSLVVIAVCAVFLSSCIRSKDFIYLQGADQVYAVPRAVEQAYDLRIQPNDELAIAVSSKNEELIKPFNNNTLIGSGSTSSSSNLESSRISYFLVDRNGKINFPIFGTISVVGKTCKQVATELQERFISENYILDAVVTVKLNSAKVTILGDVARPGQQEFTNERMTILEAIGLAGDLNNTAKRNPVLVIREVNGERIAYDVDLTDAAGLYKNPGYYLQQNDVIYVQANRAARAKSSPGYTFLTVGGTILGLLVSITSLVITLTKL